MVEEYITTTCMVVGNKASAATDRSAHHTKSRMLQQCTHAQWGTTGAWQTMLKTQTACALLWEQISVHSTKL